MSDFFKIFLTICALVASFLFGRRYGEKTYHESAEYKEFAKAAEDLNYAKSELENAKAKLQNIVDGAETKKTDELLGQILQVFLADLGLRIQNRDAILRQAHVAAISTIAPAAPLVLPPEPVEVAPIAKKPEPEAWSKANISKFKSYEWMLENSGGEKDTFRDLAKVQLKNLRQTTGETDYSRTECEAFLGGYRGSVRDINNQRYGSLVFDFRSGKVNGEAGYYGTINWFNEANSNSLSEKIGNNCGKKLKGLSGRVFNLTADRFIQVYKLSNVDKLAGNFYELLPNGTTKRIGSFILGRTDKI